MIDETQEEVWTKNEKMGSILNMVVK